jgi:hypothetical protein
MEEPKQTYGQALVRVKFNPNQDDMVYVIKMEYATLIDRHNEAIKDTGDGEEIRLHKVAITELEGACMRSVKAFTK